MSARRVLPALILAFLMGASILSVHPTAAFPVTGSQSQAVQAAFQDTLAPYNAWQRRVDSTAFYLGSSSTKQDAPPVPWSTGSVPDANMTPIKPTVEIGIEYNGPLGPMQTETEAASDPNDRQVALVTGDVNAPLIGTVVPATSKAEFPMTAASMPVDEVQLYALRVVAFAACNERALGTNDDAFGDTPTGGIRAHVDWERRDGANWTRVERLTTDGRGNENLLLMPGLPIPDLVQEYIGSLGIGDSLRQEGAKLVAGTDRLVLRLELPSNDVGARCVVHYGTADFQSRLEVTANSARINGFIQNVAGEHATALPSASNADSSTRRFTVQTLQATPWGSAGAQALAMRANVRLYDLTSQEYVNWVDDTDDAEPRERDIRIFEMVGEPKKDLLSPTVARRSYEFQYPAGYPDGAIQAEMYSLTEGWELQVDTVRLGGKGIDFKAASGEVATHLVNPGEPTEFGFLVRNTGAADDIVTVGATDMPAGWTARVLGGGRFFVKAGGFAQGSVEVTPPTAATGGSQAVTLTASSSFSDVPNPPSLTFTTQLTDTLVRKLDILSDAGVFQLRPGQEKGYSVTVRNLGTARDSVVIVPSFPANIQGWTIRTNPSSMQIPAGGLTEVQVLLTAPQTVATNTTFPLGLTAIEVGNSAVSDRVDVTVSILGLEGLLASLYDADAPRELREPGDDVCQGGDTGTLVCPGQGDPGSQVPPPPPPLPPPTGFVNTGQNIPDTDFDDSVLFRLPVQNLGDSASRFHVEAYWDRDVQGFVDSTTCNNNFILDDASDGVPDGWVFTYEQGVGDTIGRVGGGLVPKDANPPRGERSFEDGSQDLVGFSGYYQLNTTANPLVVPARTTRAVYFELGYLTVDPCPANDAPPELDEGSWSGVADLVVLIDNLDHPSQKSTVRLHATLTPAGLPSGVNRYAAQRNDVDVEMAPGAPTSLATLRTSEAVFDLVAVNKGNEKDGLRIAVTGNENWDHTIVIPLNSSVPSTLKCLPATGSSTVTCANAGAFDEVHFKVKAKPKEGKVAIGDRDSMTVTVFSTDSPGLTDTQSLVARAAGTLVFTAKVLGGTTRNVAAGSSVAFPLDVANDGTGADSYRVTVTQASRDGWKPVVSTSAPLFVPAGYHVPAFVTVTAPAGTPAGTQAEFTVQVESVNGVQRQTFQLVAVSTAPGALSLAGANGQDVLLTAREVAQDVTIVATKATGAPGENVTFHVDPDSLPGDWKFDDGEGDSDKDIVRTLAVTAGSTLPRATATFKVIAPADALGTGRAILHVDASTNGAPVLRAATDVSLDLVSTTGVRLDLENETTQTIAAGGPALYNLTVSNLGLGGDTVTLASSQLPAGWTLVLNPPSATLGPLEALDVLAKLSAPVTAKPGDQATVVLFASSALDPGQVASQVLRAQVGFNALATDLLGEGLYGAPQETLSRTLNVTNTGTLPDDVVLRAVLDTTGLRNAVNLSVAPARLALKPGQTEQVTYSITLGPDVPSGASVQATVRAASLLDPRPEAARANSSEVVTTRVLTFQALDVNGDRIVEYAVSRDRDASNGFEEFKASTTPGGRPLSVPDLARFLRDDARALFERDVTLANGTVQRVLVYTIDGDGDGKRDHFLDGDGDGQPDYYWDPDANKASPIEFRKDVNGDQAPESFVDTDGDGKLDATFDLTRGTFTKVLQVDVDGDGQLDYVVDKDGDGEVDQDETVLYTRTGGLLIVQKVDVDGDGGLDQVFDTDGDGNPDYFIPAGSTESVPITMKDVTGDGTMDWTFDGDNDGRKESYYDPATGESHTIDAAGHLADAIREYWYIGALFGVVLVLFVALVLVTRR